MINSHIHQISVQWIQTEPQYFDP